MADLTGMLSSSVMIPKELKELHQWCVAGHNKEPLNPRTLQRASTIDPSTWGTYEEAIASGGRVGFVLTTSDPYICIDLDTVKCYQNGDINQKCTQPEVVQLHQRIISHAGSYTEVSMSGVSIHIFIKAQLSAGRRNDAKHIEIYPHGRFIIMTGKLASNYCIVIAENQPFIDHLITLMPVSTAAVEVTSTASGLTDDQVIQMGIDAINGEKFNDLFEGNWTSHYGHLDPDHTKQSCSSADIGLINMLDFYTQDVNQLIRVFQRSKLYRGDIMRNRQEPYIERTLAKARSMNEAKKPPPIDPTALIENGTKLIEKLEMASLTNKESSGVDNSLSELGRPPGLLGDIAEYIFSAATRPVWEVAIAGALALMAGVSARQYTYSAVGMNMYIVLLAKTGRGKEAANTGISVLMKAVQQTVPMASEFMGPSMFASGQALMKVLANSPCILVQIGEIGHKLSQWSSDRVSPVDEELQRMLLDIYQKSGPSGVLNGTAYSNKDNNTGGVFSPNLTILGDTNPDKLFNAIGDDGISSGFLPRFTFIEYTGPRPTRNPNVDCPPNPTLIHNLSEHIAYMLTISANNQRIPVNHTSEAVAILDEFDLECDSEINDNNQFAELWNRAHLKSLKLAALIAIGVNPGNPVITEMEAEWAVGFTKLDVDTVASRFRDNAVGSGDRKQEHDIRNAINAYFPMSMAKRQKLGASKKLAPHKDLIPYGYLRRYLRTRASFYLSKIGTANAINNALDDLVKSEILVEVNAVDRKTKYKTNARLFGIGSEY